MLVCNYCKRNFKEEYKNCPGCGSDSFNKIDDKLEYIIDTPPTGGYKLVNMREFKVSDKDKNTVINVFVIMILIIMFIIYLFFSFIFKEEMLHIPYIIIYLGLNIICIIIAILLLIGKNKIKLDNRLTKRGKLQTKGVLYKNLPYEVETTEYRDSDNHLHRYYKIKVVYTLNDGVERKFYSSPKYKQEDTINKNGTADLLVDPEDYNNYFVDLEIY